MTDGPTFWLAIALAGAVTYAIRSVLFLLAGRLTRLPVPVETALRMIPAAALAALAIPALLRPGGSDAPIDLVSPELFAGALAAAVAVRTRNLLATIATGLVAVVLLEQVLA